MRRSPHSEQSYTIPIFKKGYKGDLEESDLLGPIKRDQSSIVGDTIEATWFAELELSRQRNRKPNLLKVVFRAFYWDFLILGAFQMVCDMVLRMSQPLVLGHLLSYFKPGSGVTKQEAYISSAVLALIVGLTAIVYNHTVLRSFNLGMRVRVALSSLIYRKDDSLKVSAHWVGTAQSARTEWKVQLVRIIICYQDAPITSAPPGTDTLPFRSIDSPGEGIKIKCNPETLRHLQPDQGIINRNANSYFLEHANEKFSFWLKSSCANRVSTRFANTDSGRTAPKMCGIDPVGAYLLKHYGLIP
uniref:ABC transmembrane type-1 domain-containing protein n=1 Tax=Timema shepardi TaxID=629360 RepID=A0A7R9FYH4_TIMSH|nr:unnamed protein product [Timema shepardi]